MEEPYSKKMILDLIGDQAKDNPLLTLIERQQNEISELKEKIEKLKPFISMFNEHFGTDLTIGSDEFNDTFAKYKIVEIEKDK